MFGITGSIVKGERRRYVRKVDPDVDEGFETGTGGI
jgi:hypothetical protein